MKIESKTGEQVGTPRSEIAEEIRVTVAVVAFGKAHDLLRHRSV